jgi:Na+-transporting methylmalonyl-CoA/oxaloacetate decarboxylase gamma subunit
MENLTAGYTFLGFFLFALGLVLSVLWILVPFAVFGIKGLLRRQIEEQRRSNELLATIAQRQQIFADTYAATTTVVRERPVVPPL